MTAHEVFLAAFAAQCAVKVLEIAGCALREWFFTVPDGCPERPAVVTQRGWMGDRSGTPFGPAD